MAERCRPFLSVVVPLFDEEENVAELCRRLLAVLDGLGAPFEAIFVDDGSRDRTLERLREATRGRGEVIVRELARNFGQHSAVTAGFDAARGEFVVTLDADLQNPPEEIPRLVAEFRRGHDFVGTIRARRHDSRFRRLASTLVNALMRRTSGIELHDFGCMLRGYSARIVRAIVGRRECHTFIPALAYLHARDPVEIEVAHARRARGASKYSLRRLLRLQLDLVTSFSLSPLRVLFAAGMGIACVGVLFGLLLLALRLLRGPGWAAEGVFTLFAVLFVFVGAQFVAFGLLGEYVGRIFLAVHDRPPYVLREPPARRPRVEAAQRGVAPAAERVAP
jgi:undecaprenyl-phosphate 4-deoxy-4-formamido-L-arabinose transferase